MNVYSPKIGSLSVESIFRDSFWVLFYQSTRFCSTLTVPVFPRRSCLSPLNVETEAFLI